MAEVAMNVRSECRVWGDASPTPKISARVSRKRRAVEYVMGASKVLFHWPRMAGRAHEGPFPKHFVNTPVHSTRGTCQPTGPEMPRTDEAHDASPARHVFALYMVPRIAVSLADKKSMR